MMTPILLNYRYQVIRVLGSGGFGETFLAEDTQMPAKRRCVIKLLKPVADNPQVYQLVQERFQREAAILEELGEGNSQIPSLYAYFCEDGQFYLAQEYIEGQTLIEKLRQYGTLSESSVKEILVSILPVLNYVHSKGIVHRDIKPDNILIRNSNQQPVLIDFGAVKETIATVVTASGNSSQSIVIGTPGFMPSEQTAGRPVFSSDLYSLGLTAIYLLTGKFPQELATNPSTGEILWRQYALSVTPTFAAILDKAIQPFAPHRYSSALEMLQAIQTGATPIAPTLPAVNPTLISAAPTGARMHGYVQPQQASTVIAPPPSPGTPYQQPQTAPGMSDLQKALVMGGVIGVCVLGGLLIIDRKETQPQTAVVQQSTSPAPAQIPASSNQVISASPVNSSVDSNISTSSPITRDAALALVNKWQESKKYIFAPPYNHELGAQLTTGEAYRKNISYDGSSRDWLVSNNAYYRYGVQSIDSVGAFAANGDQATIEIAMTEDRTFYKNGKVVNDENTAFDKRLVRYSLQMSDGQLKISDYKTVKDLAN